MNPTNSFRAGALALACLAAAAPPARALDLPGALANVAAASPTLAARRSLVTAAEKRVPQAGAWTSPMLEFGAVNVPMGGGFDEDMMTMKMIGLAQRVPLFGANGLRADAARSAALGEGAAAEMAHYEMFAAAGEAYLDAYWAAERVRIAREHGADMDGYVRAARARYDAGGGRLDDVLRAEAVHARSEADVAAFEAEAAEARARLDALMGRDPGGPAEPLDPPPPSVVPASPAAWSAALTPQHPRLREFAARIDRDRLSARAARRATWPDLELRGSIGLREPIMGEPQDDMWSASVGFMLPIFAGGNQRAQGAEMDARARAGEADLRAATLELERQVVAGHAVARAMERSVSVLADTVLVTRRRAVQAAWGAYRAGATDLARVLDTSHELYDEEIAVTRARQQLARAQARMVAVTANGEPLGVTLPAIERSEP